MNHLTVIGIVLLLLLLQPGISAVEIPEDLQIITEEYAPLNYLENGTLKGISIDVTEEVLSRLGSPITRNAMTLLPWDEGYDLVQHTPNSMLLTTDRLKDRESLFLWAGPVLTLEQVLFVRSDANISSGDDIAGLKIVVLADDCARTYALNAGADEDQVLEVRSASEAVAMVENRTADGWAYNEIAGKRAIDTYATEPDEFAIGRELGTGMFYLAFNPDTPQEVVDAFNATIRDIKMDRSTTGITRYEEIVARYQPVQCAEQSIDKTRIMDLVNQTAEDLSHDAPGTIAAILAGESPYRDLTDPDLYVFVFDTDVTLIANAVTSYNVGKNLSGTTDVFGTPFRDELVQGALQNGTGWQSYVYSNPSSLGLFEKMSYYQLTTGSDGAAYVVGAGRYLTCDEMNTP